MMKRTTTIVLAAMAGLLLAAAPNASAAIVVNESFNIGSGSGEYTDGVSLQNQPTTGAATNGWAGAWDVTATNDSFSESGGLTYSAGSIGQIGGTGGSNGNAVISGATDRVIASNGTLQTATTLWARVLFQSAGNDAFFSFRTDGSANNGRVTFRHTDTKGDILLRTLDGTNISDPADPGFQSQIVTGVTNLMVFKFTIDRSGTAAETVDFWLDPTTSNEALLGAPTATVSGNILDSTNNQINFFNLTGGDSNYKADEIAIGETFNDVVPVPEPASLTMGLAGLTLLLGRRRRTL